MFKFVFYKISFRECEDCGNFVCISSYSSNHLDDNVPIGSILQNVYVQRIQDDVFIYTRYWKTSHSITITNLCHLTGKNWILKIERIFEICNISRSVIIAMYNHANYNVQIHFMRKHTQKFCRDKIKLYLEMYYKNLVFVK